MFVLQRSILDYMIEIRFWEFCCLSWVNRFSTYFHFGTDPIINLNFLGFIRFNLRLKKLREKIRDTSQEIRSTFHNALFKFITWNLFSKLVFP